MFTPQSKSSFTDAMLSRLPKDALESPLEYNRGRDIHASGIILVQMLLGRDIVERYPDVHSALAHGESPSFIGLCLVLITCSCSYSVSSLAPNGGQHADPDETKRQLFLPYRGISWCSNQQWPTLSFHSIFRYVAFSYYDLNGLTSIV